jgi:hypothetical protein
MPPPAEASPDRPPSVEATPEKPPAEKATKDSPPFFERNQPDERSHKSAASPLRPAGDAMVELSEREKQADEWVTKATKNDPPPHPTWFEIFASLERKHGKGQVPCQLYDSLREDYWEEFVRPKALSGRYSIVSVREEFMKATDLPTRRLTLTGRQRIGCKE